MSTQHLGPQVDIHTGGVDNIFPHHEDERAQSEAFTGVGPFARVWLHGQHLLADGLKMAKSTGNAYTLDDLLALNFEPLAFRYLCLTAHYRARLNFTFTSLRAAQTGLHRLRRHAAQWGSPAADALDKLSEEAEACRRTFWALAADDLRCRDAWRWCGRWRADHWPTAGCREGGARARVRHGCSAWTWGLRQSIGRPTRSVAAVSSPREMSRWSSSSPTVASCRS